MTYYWLVLFFATAASALLVSFGAPAAPCQTGIVNVTVQQTGSMVMLRVPAVSCIVPSNAIQGVLRASVPLPALPPEDLCLTVQVLNGGATTTGSVYIFANTGAWQFYGNDYCGDGFQPYGRAGLGMNAATSTLITYSTL